jgi:hypothetical protein
LYPHIGLKIIQDTFREDAVTCPAQDDYGARKISTVRHGFLDLIQQESRAFHLLVVYIPYGDAYYLGMKGFNCLHDGQPVVLPGHEVEQSYLMPCVSCRYSYTIQSQGQRKDIDLFGICGNKEYSHVLF